MNIGEILRSAEARVLDQPRASRNCSLWSSSNFEANVSLAEIQARFIVHRFGLSPRRAAIIAPFALGTPAAIVRSIEDARLAFAARGIETREAGRCAAS